MAANLKLFVRLVQKVLIKLWGAYSAPCYRPSSSTLHWHMWRSRKEKVCHVLWENTEMGSSKIQLTCSNSEVPHLRSSGEQVLLFIARCEKKDTTQQPSEYWKILVFVQENNSSPPGVWGRFNRVGLSCDTFTIRCVFGRWNNFLWIWSLAVHYLL